MYFDRNGKTPHFEVDEIRMILANSKRTDTATLQAVARELFPGRDPIAYENLFSFPGPGRSFKHKGEEYVRPKFCINAHPVIVGVMDDGTVYQF